MLKSIKIIVREYQKKEGGTFTKITCGGKYLPLAVAEEDVNYTVKFTSKSKAPVPTKEGIYEVAYEDGALWIDQRPEAQGRAILRINASKVVFSRVLPKLEKDIRLK